MFTSLLTSLIGGLGGGLFRLAPEIVKFFSDRNDKDHEYRMTQLQLEIDKARSQQQIDLAHVTGSIEEQNKFLDAYKSAIEGQSQKTGIGIVDALNFLVRPLTTYFFLFLYGMVKLSTIRIACESTDAWHAILQSWNSDDVAIFSGIIAFWFVGRVFSSDHKK